MLALREFFWGVWPGGGASATATATAVVSLSVTVSGAGSGKMRWFADDTEPALEEFWDVREAYLKRVFSAAEIEAPSEIVNERIAVLDPSSDDRAVIEGIAQARERAFREAQQAETREVLEAQASLITKLSLQLAELTAIRQIDDEVVLLLLLTE